MEESVNNNISNSKSELWNLSLRDLFYKYVRFLPLFVLSVAFALLGAYIYLRYAVPVYSSGGTILIKSDQPGTTRGDKFDELYSNGGAQNIQSEIEILKSRPLMERVVRILGLQWSYQAVGRFKTMNIYNQGPFLVKALKINDSTKTFLLKIKFLNDEEFRINNESTVYHFDQSFQNSHGVFQLVKNLGVAGTNSYEVRWVPYNSAAGQYSNAIQVVPKSPGTGILNIAMLTSHPQLGSDVINKLMEEYSGYSVEQKKVSLNQTLGFINERMVDIGSKLDSVTKVYLDYQTKYNMIDAEAQLSTYFGTIGESDKALNEQTILLNVANMIDAYLSDKKNEFSKMVVPSSLGITDPTLNQMISEYNKAQIQRKLYIDANVPVENPLVKELDGAIEKLRGNIRENIKNIRTANNSAISKYKERSNISESQLRAMPVKIKELAEIKRQKEIYEGLYKLFTEKKEETSIQISATVPNSEIIGRSYPVFTPVKPSRKTIQVLAILLGLLIPALIIFIGEVLNDKVSTRFDIEKISAAPILGEIGHSYSEQVLVVSTTTRSMVAEQFRIIRSNLQYILGKKEKSVILVTSSFSEEGKSYVSTNMGAVLALTGKKTVILEFDIRKPKILSGLGMQKGPGISNFLVGKSNLPDLIKPVPEHENLFILGCGPIPPNPAELLLDPKVDEMFAWLRENFDVVLIDTAPVGMVSDAMTLGKYADCTLYLVRQGHTFKKQVALIDEFYKESKLPRVSIIINDVKLKPGYGYYGYGRYGYGYGYGYGSYYEEETPPQNLMEKTLGKLNIRKYFGGKKK